MPARRQRKIDETQDALASRATPPARDVRHVVVSPDEVFPLPAKKRAPLEVVVVRYVLLSTGVVVVTLLLAGLGLALFAR